MIPPGDRLQSSSTLPSTLPVTLPAFFSSPNCFYRHWESCFRGHVSQRLCSKGLCLYPSFVGCIHCRRPSYLLSCWYSPLLRLHDAVERDLKNSDSLMPFCERDTAIIGMMDPIILGYLIRYTTCTILQKIIRAICYNLIELQWAKAGCIWTEVMCNAFAGAKSLPIIINWLKYCIYTYWQILYIICALLLCVLELLWASDQVDTPGWVCQKSTF